MWQELNETNQAGSGDDFFQEKLQRISVYNAPTPILFIPIWMSKIDTQKICFLSYFLFIASSPLNYGKVFQLSLIYFEKSKNELHIKFRQLTI